MAVLRDKPTDPGSYVSFGIGTVFQYGTERVLLTKTGLDSREGCPALIFLDRCRVILLWSDSFEGDEVPREYLEDVINEYGLIVEEAK